LVIAFGLLTSDRHLHLFILLVLLLFIQVLPFCIFILPRSSVHIWEFFFDIKEIFFHLVLALSIVWRFLDSHESYLVY